MKKRGRYELLEPIAGASHTFRGSEPGSAMSVIVHLLEACGQASANALLQQVMALPPAAYQHVCEIGDCDGALYVITDTHFGETTLEEWLKRARAADMRYSVQAKAPAPAAEEKTAQAGEFTRLFQAPAAEPPQAAPQDSAGEFTRLFAMPKAVREPRPVQVPPRPTLASSPAPAPEAVAGEFTKMFSSPLAAEPVHPKPGNGAGEITQLFERPAAAAGPGELTRLLNATGPTPPAAQPAPAAPPQEVGDFTRLLGSPAAVTPVAAAAPKAAGPAPAAILAPGPGDYTRAIAARPPAAEAATAPAPPLAAPSAAKSAAAPAPTKAQMMVVFSVLAILAVALILFFALRH